MASLLSVIKFHFPDHNWWKVSKEAKARSEDGAIYAGDSTHTRIIVYVEDVSGKGERTRNAYTVEVRFVRTPQACITSRGTLKDCFCMVKHVLRNIHAGTYKELLTKQARVRER